jgi:hypothetical protein
LSNPPLHALAYVSRVSAPLSRAKLNEIVAGAIEFNGQNDVSGALIFDGTSFFQYVEGRESDLASAYERICASRSHVVLLELLNGAVPVRRFTGWEMFYAESAPSGIEGLNWLPGREPSDSARRDIVASSLRFFWQSFQEKQGVIDLA